MFKKIEMRTLPEKPITPPGRYIVDHSENSPLTIAEKIAHSNIKYRDELEEYRKFYRRYPKPLGPKTPLQCYMNDMEDNYRDMYPNSSYKEMMNTFLIKWRRLSIDEKTPYNELCLEDCNRYFKETEEYYGRIYSQK